MVTGPYEPSAFDWVRQQVELFERSGGREGNTVDGRPIVVLATRGARTGSTRKSPVMRMERDGTYVVIGSVGGSPRHPAWYHNLLADPACRVQDGAETLVMRAREATGAERQELWDEAVAGWAHYAEMQAKTTRTFPILVLEPVA